MPPSSLLSIITVTVLFAVRPAAAGADDASINRARELLRLFLDGRHEDFVAAGTEEVRKGFSAGQSRELLESLRKQYGPFVKELDATPRIVGKLRTVVFRTRFETSILKLQVTLDAADRMAGFHIVGVEPLQGWKPPKYVKKDRFEVRKTTLRSGKYELPAVLTIPKGASKVPGVVLVHGSGPHDEDESIGPNKPFRDLAEGLASRGIAVLRYEKRTRKYGGRMKAEDVTIDEEVIEDALSAIRLLRSRERIDPAKVFLLGHSLGGMAAPFIAARDKRLAGIIIMAGSARPVIDVVEEQLAYIANLDGVLSDEEAKQLEEARQAAEAIRAGKPDEVKKPLLGAPASYWQRINAMDPVAEAGKLDCRILILQGGRDYQVTRKCFERWKEGLASRKNVSFRFYEPMNHLMISGKGPATPGDYEKAGHVSKRVVADIAEWILHEPRSGK